MGGHQGVGKEVHIRAQIFLHTAQEIQIIIALEEYPLAIIAAIIEMIVLVG